MIEAGEAADAADPALRRWSPAAASAAGLALLAVVVGAVRTAMWTRGKTPLADDAGLELRLRDMPGHIPLTGAYSRVGWFHPGPLAMWFSWPFEATMGAVGLYVAAAVLDVAMVALAFVAVRKTWPPAAAAGVIVLVAAWVVLAFDDFIVDPWNPTTTVLALLAAALCATAVPVESRLAFGVVAAASVAAQAHVACLVPCAALLIYTFVEARRRWRPLLATLVVLWIGPLIDLVAGKHNLYHVAEDLLTGDGGRYGARRAIGALVAVFDPRHALRAGRVPVDAVAIDGRATPAGAVCLALAVALCAWAAWRCAGVTRRWATIVLAGIVIGFLSLSSAQQPVYAHVVAWVALLPLASVVVAWSVVAERRPVSRLPVATVATVLAAVLLVVASARATTPRRVTTMSRDDIPAVAAAIVQRFGTDPLVLADDDEYATGYVVGVANEIERRGGHVKIEGPWGEHGKFGDGRTPGAADDALTHLLVVTRRDGSAAPAGLGAEVAAVELTDRGHGRLSAHVVSVGRGGR